VQITEGTECDDEKTSEPECVVYFAKRTIGSLAITFRTAGAFVCRNPALHGQMCVTQLANSRGQDEPSGGHKPITGKEDTEREDTSKNPGQLDETFVSESLSVSTEIVVVLDISEET